MNRRAVNRRIPERRRTDAIVYSAAIAVTGYISGILKFTDLVEAAELEKEWKKKLREREAMFSENYRMLLQTRLLPRTFVVARATEDWEKIIKRSLYEMVRLQGLLMLIK